VLRMIRDAKIPMIELLVLGVNVEMQYCPAGKLLEKYNLSQKRTNCRWDDMLDLSAGEVGLPGSTLKQLNSYRDDLTVLKTVPILDTFRLARRVFKYFCARRGIYGAKFGLLSGLTVTLLIAGICRMLPADATAVEVLAAAIERYADFAWETEVLWFPGVERGQVKREERAAMYISSIHRPVRNAMRNASRSTMRTIVNELKLAKDKFTESFEDVCKEGLSDFFTGYKSFVKIQCAFWGVNPADGRKWITWIESRLVVLLVNLARDIPQLETRLWPARFGHADSEGVQGTYLVGVSGTGINEGTLLTVLRDAERMMKGEETEVEDRWVSVGLVRGKDLRAEKLHVDTTVWEFEEEIVLDDNEEDEEPGAPPPNVEQLTMSDVKAGKLRPSHDIFNRLFWDASYSADAYVVGYEDRFKGVREMPLTSWKREFTDEEFIPFHRVVYFREKGLDGKIVWDRRSRVDLIFGSGQRR